MKNTSIKIISINIIICLIVISFAWACTEQKPATTTTTPPPATGGPQYGGTLKIGDFAEGNSSGYPPKLAQAQSNRQAAPAVETLFHFDSTGKLVPWLATDYKNDAQAKTITLMLRKGVKFHDGTDFNADAVKWNLEQCMTAKMAATSKFKNIDIVDDYTVRINLTDWDSTVNNNLAMTAGMMISPSAYKKNGEDWCANNPVGTGPFQIVSWQKQVSMKYKKFDGYWQKGKPYLDGIDWIYVADTTTRIMSFQGKELDQLVTLWDFVKIADLEKSGDLVTRVRAGAGCMGYVPDSANPNSPFSNVKVRQAVQYAIDSPTILKAVFFGEGEPANQWIYKGHWAYNPSIAGYPYNPDKAKQLLSEAGYPNGFKTKIVTAAGGIYEQTSLAVQGYLKAIGIDAPLEPGEPAKINMSIFGGQAWDGLLWSNPTGDVDVTALLKQRYTGTGGWYTKMLVPDDYLAAINGAIAAPDFETKQKLTQEAMKLMVDKYCLQTFVFVRNDTAVSHPNVQGTGFMKTPFGGQWTPEDTWFKK